MRWLKPMRKLAQPHQLVTYLHYTFDGCVVLRQGAADYHA